MQTYAEQRNEIHKRQTRAALCIQRTYSRFRDRTIFNFLKSAMCRAERAVSSELLKRINPGESYILRDPAMTGKIRLRFGGSVFPPRIMYKIYSSQPQIYMAGCNMIAPGSEAARDAWAMMGGYKYMKMLEVDSKLVTPVPGVQMDLKSRQQIASAWDSRPIHLGGRNNHWRWLFQADTSYLQQIAVLSNEESTSVPFPSLLDRVCFRDEMSRSNGPFKPPHLRPLGHTLSDEQKRAAVAKQRKLESLKMRKLYLTGVGPGGGSAKASTHATDMAEPNFHGPSSAGTLGASNAFSDSGGQKRWSAAERPADTEEDLVQWTKELSFDDYHDQWEQRARMQ